jgi:PIN domain nuclease of toxin-antitoxin system
MNLLLDTHMVLWTAFWPGRIPRRAVEAIERADAIYVSSVSIFEIAIKASIGKLKIPFQGLEGKLAAAGARQISLTWEHALRSHDIAATHPDPFDRLLLAQAIVEPLYLLTADESLAQYGGGLVLFVD